METAHRTRPERIDATSSMPHGRHRGLQPLWLPPRRLRPYSGCLHRIHSTLQRQQLKLLLWPPRQRSFSKSMKPSSWHQATERMETSPFFSICHVCMYNKYNVASSGAEDLHGSKTPVTSSSYEKCFFLFLIFIFGSSRRLISMSFPLNLIRSLFRFPRIALGFLVVAFVSYFVLCVQHVHLYWVTVFGKRMRSADSDCSVTVVIMEKKC